MKLVALLMVGVALTSAMGCSSPSPSDAQLIERFARHRDEYERLVFMLTEDHRLQSVWPTSARPEHAVDAARLAQYRQAMDTLGLEGGISKSGEFILFTVSGSGLVSGGARKGIAYAATPPATTFSSLDAIPSNLQLNTLGFKRIDEHWYVFMEYGG